MGDWVSYGFLFCFRKILTKMKLSVLSEICQFLLGSTKLNKYIGVLLTIRDDHLTKQKWRFVSVLSCYKDQPNLSCKNRSKTAPSPMVAKYHFCNLQNRSPVLQACKTEFN